MILLDLNFGLHLALHSHAERCEMESEALIIDPALLPTLEGLLQEMYASLRPEPVNYEHRHLMVDVFNKIAEQIFGKKNGLPVVEAFGSFTMDLFTPKSDLDLSVNFNTDTKDQFPRKDKISAIRRLAKVLHSHQRSGRCYGVSPIVTARVPVLKVIDQGTGVECDISVENKDGMSRSMIFTCISSIDDRFRILCYLMKFWAKAHDVNSPKDRTMSSMAIISLVAFHLQTRHPPILPAFSAILKDGSDFASIERSVSLFEGFGSRNKESIAELFASLMSKLVSVEGLWEQGLCASNFEGLWISKTWERGVSNLSVEDFLDQSQNFARSVGKEEMQKICEYLRVTVSNLSKFFMGKIDAPKLKALLFGPLNQDKPITNVNQKIAKGKDVNRNKTSTNPRQKNDKRKNLDQDKPVTCPVEKDAKKKSILGPDSGNSHVQQKRVKPTAHTVPAAYIPVSSSRPPTVFIPQMHRPVVATQPSTQFAHMPQHLITSSGHAYELSRPRLHSVYHPHQGLVGLPQGNFIHLNPVQLQHQGQVINGFPPAAQHPVINGFHPHPYGINGAQQMQLNDDRFVQRTPYGFGPSLWR
ncbi:protein HESO1-like isoform X2 [Phragmites australis]|uniref:protein HESO1-like isoform X2 n=1 Tax=Phragmites australis TaxID=29695 RepID=UPI002D769640|nr:protein HESO1-like isoform X2 [Phragmites australis]XP_062191976.1 protein HESO1-like isoform X2 [Phragmites australis]XP_062191977.1 protein HESO1-like isoform X2 [Phragmites australis]